MMYILLHVLEDLVSDLETRKDLALDLRILDVVHHLLQCHELVLSLLQSLGLKGPKSEDSLCFISLALREEYLGLRIVAIDS